MKKKIFVCGGHVTPALAVMDELAPEYDLVYLGRPRAVEHTLVADKGIRFLPIAKLPFGLLQALWYILMERPSLVLSFGSFVAIPTAYAARMLRIPVVTHEQTLTLGRANALIATFAKRVCVTFEETKQDYPQAVVTGLPMRKELFTKAPYKTDRPLLYITGGSQGAQSLNEKIVPVLPDLRKHYTVVHQTNAASFISGSRLAGILQHARIIIGRSGANTVMEIAALGNVGILVPLPWSVGNEQSKLAHWLEKHGGVVVVSQEQLTGDLLLQTIQRVEKQYTVLQKWAQALAKTIPRDGAARVAAIVRDLL